VNPVLAEFTATEAKEGNVILKNSYGGCDFILRERLSSREQQVLRFLMEGETNPTIARQLNISNNTVKSHVIHIFNKLGVQNRTQAAVKAARMNLDVE